jgi:hypothetical protein
MIEEEKKLLGVAWGMALFYGIINEVGKIQGGR